MLFQRESSITACYERNTEDCTYGDGGDSTDTANAEDCLVEEDTSYESDTAEEKIEVAEQPMFGLTVDVNTGMCACRTWTNHAYCVHLIACRVRLRLPVVGLKPPRVVFVTKGKKHRQEARSTNACRTSLVVRLVTSVRSRRRQKMEASL